MAGFKDLIGKVISKKIKFLDSEIVIRKLSLEQTQEIQEQAKNIGENEGNALKMLMSVIVLSVEGAEEMTEDEFRKFPIEDLNKLSEDILKYSGLGKAPEKASS
jgi:hypothetical protein